MNVEQTSTQDPQSKSENQESAPLDTIPSKENGSVQLKNQEQALNKWKQKTEQFKKDLQELLQTPIPEVELPAMIGKKLFTFDQLLILLIENNLNIDSMQLSFEIKKKMEEYVEKLTRAKEGNENDQNCQNQIIDEEQEQKREIQIENLKQQIEKEDFADLIAKKAVYRNYGLAKNSKIKDFKEIQKNIWEMKDIQDFLLLDMEIGPIQGIYTERKNLKDKISKYSTLIGKIETAKINEKLGKTLEDISACFNKLHEATEKKSKKAKTIRASDQNGAIQNIEENIEKKLLLSTPDKSAESGKKKQKSKKKPTNKKQKVNFVAEVEKIEEKPENEEQEDEKKQIETQNQNTEDPQAITKATQSKNKKSTVKEQKTTDKPKQSTINNKKISDFFQVKQSKAKEQMEVEQPSQEIKKQLFKKCGERNSYLCNISLTHDEQQSFNNFYTFLRNRQEIPDDLILNSFKEMQKSCKRQHCKAQKIRKIYIFLKDSKVSYKNVIFDKTSAFINPKNFLAKDPTMNYDISSDEELQDRDYEELYFFIFLFTIKRDEENRSQESEQNISGFLVVPDNEFLTDVDSQSDDEGDVQKPTMWNQNTLNNMMEKKKKLEPYMLQSAHGGDCLKHLSENFKISTFGGLVFPIPVTQDTKQKIDLFEENNQEMLKELIKRVHGSYEYKKELIQSFINDYPEKKINKRKVEQKLELIADKLEEKQYYKDQDKVPKILVEKEPNSSIKTENNTINYQQDCGKRYFVSETVLNAVEMDQQLIQQLLDDKKRAKIHEKEEKKQKMKLKMQEKQQQKKIEKQSKQKTLNDFVGVKENENSLQIAISNNDSAQNEYSNAQGMDGPQFSHQEDQRSEIKQEEENFESEIKQEEIQQNQDIKQEMQIE